MLATLNGKTINYEVYGEGQPVVLIHGLGVTHQMWNWQIEDLQQDYQVIVYDLPGHGESEYRLPETEINRELATDLRHLLDHLEVEQAAVVGLSLGGRVALALATHYPERVSRLILSSTVDRVQGEQEESRTDLGIKMLAAMDMEQILTTSGQAFFSSPEHKDALELYDQIARQVEKEAMLHLSPAVKEDYQQHLQNIQVPTLIFVGEKEQLMSEIAERMASLIPDAKLDIIPGVGHIWNMEEPELFNQKIREFIGTK